jgi:hypothetical protein
VFFFSFVFLRFVTSVSGLSTFDCPFGILYCLFRTKTLTVLLSNALQNLHANKFSNMTFYAGLVYNCPFGILYCLFRTKTLTVLLSNALQNLHANKFSNMTFYAGLVYGV